VAHGGPSGRLAVVIKFDMNRGKEGGMNTGEQRVRR